MFAAMDKRRPRSVPRPPHRGRSGHGRYHFGEGGMTLPFTISRDDPSGDNESHRVYGVAGLRDIIDVTPSVVIPASVPFDTKEPVAPLPAVTTWPKLDGAALHGIAGEIVQTVGPHSEA